MATHDGVQRIPEDLHGAMAEVQAAYDRLMAAEHPDPQLLLDLQRRNVELHAAAERARVAEPHGRAERIHSRCEGATRGARWIIQHAG
ncbi:hypothetical protein AB0K43_13280 [Kitasatospora sp. NPDC049258]|uniref:hypothetical protein n=1 Tax=Kitasatospora sp. NPDC049258 TaxID=3155394 RepID=UPI00342083AF